MAEMEGDLPIHRILIVGDAGVGKSALALQFVYGEVTKLVSQICYDVFFFLSVTDFFLRARSLKKTSRYPRTVTAK